MFTILINTNQPMPDPRAGSAPALVGMRTSHATLCLTVILTHRIAYSTACLASQNITIPAPSTKLILPDSWDGPFDVVMGLPGTIITVMVGAGLAVSAIFLLSNM